MTSRRLTGFLSSLPLLGVLTLALAAAGCGSEEAEMNPDGSIVLAPGTVDLENEVEPEVPARRGR